MTFHDIFQRFPVVLRTFPGHFPRPRMEKNALRAMEAGGRTSVAAAYEAMAAKEAGPTSHGWLFFFGQKKMLGFVENVEIHGI